MISVGWTDFRSGHYRVREEVSWEISTSCELNIGVLSTVYTVRRGKGQFSSFFLFKNKKCLSSYSFLPFYINWSTICFSNLWNILVVQNTLNISYTTWVITRCECVHMKEEKNTTVHSHISKHWKVVLLQDILDCWLMWMIHAAFWTRIRLLSDVFCHTAKSFNDDCNLAHGEQNCFQLQLVVACI